MPHELLKIAPASRPTSLRQTTRRWPEEETRVNLDAFDVDKYKAESFGIGQVEMDGAVTQWNGTVRGTGLFTQRTRQAHAHFAANITAHTSHACDTCERVWFITHKRHR